LQIFLLHRFSSALPIYTYEDPMSDHDSSLSRRHFLQESAAAAGALTLASATLGACSDDEEITTNASDAVDTSTVGGVAAGGSSIGGVPGGSPTGGNTGGDPTGGMTTGGDPMGGGATGGDPMGGSPTGGSPTGGNPTGGSPTGGMMMSGGTDAGAVDDFAGGQNRSFGSAMPTPLPIVLRRTADRIGAPSNVCTHQSCQIFNGQDSGNAGDDPTLSGFYCFCHASVYDDEGRVTTIATGATQQDDLPWFQVTITNGRVIVDMTTVVATGTYTALP